MYITEIRKESDNPFLNLYHAKFLDREDDLRDYYFCSRNDEEHLKAKTHELTAEGIAAYGVTTEDEPRLLLIREYRLPVDAYIYSLPVGLIDPGETPGEAAVREVKEETGYRFTEYTGGAEFARRPFLLAPGFSDEPGTAVFGTITDLDSEPESEVTERITPLLADKAEVRRILNEEATSVRAAMLMMNFLASTPEAPFAFLDI